MIARACRQLRRRLEDEGGFTLVEALAAITILAVGAFAAAQALSFGLATSGMSRQRLAARSAADQQMELARALNYDNLVLNDTSPIPHSSDPENPDYWVDGSAQTFDPDGSGPLAAEPIVRDPGASPALAHIQTPVTQGNTTYAIYVYITWVDSPTDGLAGADKNTNGNDAAGQDQKRVTTTITWSDAFNSGLTSITQSSIFSSGRIDYHQPTFNKPPTVSCPTVTNVSALTVTFNAVVTDSDGTVTSVSWNFGDGVLGSGLTNVSHTYPSGTNTYTIVNSATDDAGGTATNTSLNCQIKVTDPASGNGGPSGTIKILNDVPYTKQADGITLNLSAIGASQMQFSNDGVTWAAKITYATSTIWSLTPGDGLKTVWARFYNSSGLVGAWVSDTITLDTIPPGAPSGLSHSTSTQGALKTITLTWSQPSPLPPDLAGYRVWRRLTTSSTWTQISCTAGGTTCADTVKKADSYVYYVEAYDNAGNTSAPSDQITA
jgi:type II secretory pathway pseudopilin PulG